MSADVIESLLKRAIGLDAASIGHSAVLRAVRARLAETGCADVETYAATLTRSPEELQELVESVVVPETWFFRDSEAFALLVRRVSSLPSLAQGAGPLRVLSAPCATGEEPYSIAIALLDAGLAADKIEIDAIDISGHALARAREARYGRNSFRTQDLGFRERHFAPAGPRWQLAESVRRLVRLEQANLLDASFAAQRAPYDVVFCRNLLIYFDRATQDRAVAALRQLLHPGGLLLVGPSETALLLDHGFAAVPAPMAFAFTTASALATAVPPALPPVRPPPAPRSRPMRERVPSPAVPPRPAPAPKPPAAAPTDPAGALREIAELANAGHLAEAARRCEEHVRAHGRSAEALYLLGLVRDASGKHEEAASFYRKALYLDPQHHAALVSLAYLREARGDAAEARVLRERAKRAAGRRKEAEA